MFKTFRRSLLVAGALAAASLGFAGPSAAAGDGWATVTAPAAGFVLAHYHDRGEFWHDRGESRHDAVDRRGRDDRRNGYEQRSSCAPGQALRKAGRLGLRRAEIVRDNRRVVVVDGWKRGRLVSVRFAQERGCPMIGLR